MNGSSKFSGVSIMMMLVFCVYIGQAQSLESDELFAQYYTNSSVVSIIIEKEMLIEIASNNSNDSIPNILSMAGKLDKVWILKQTLTNENPGTLFDEVVSWLDANEYSLYGEHNIDDVYSVVYIGENSSELILVSKADSINTAYLLRGAMDEKTINELSVFAGASLAKPLTGR